MGVAARQHIWRRLRERGSPEPQQFAQHKVARQVRLHNRASALGGSPSPDESAPRPLVSRRHALLGLTGTTLTAATALTTWKILDTGSSGSHSGGKSSPSATPTPTRTPGKQLWAFPTSGVESSPTVVDGGVYVGSDDNNLYAVQTLAVDATGTGRFDLTCRAQKQLL
ncbi:PQQ-binding-like beta-propeller repeat protein [Streptomyces echinatus]|uniref:PQQ-binding-like beta-propeller repeat protein n=1 Tax=Streptomyces echinatus TaxID=67293 RepID=UPI0037FCFBA1